MSLFSYSHGGLQITTNLKRSLHTGNLPGNLALKPVAIAPRATRTGLYASHVLTVNVTDKKLKHPEFGLRLGAISKVVNNTHKQIANIKQI